MATHADLKRILGVLHEVQGYARCHRRKIGCVLVDASGVVVAVGINGPDAIFPNCAEVAWCPDANVQAGEGATRSVRCWGAHAEQRACVALRGSDIVYPLTAFCTKAPCPACCQLLYGAGVRTIVYETMSNDTDNRELWSNILGFPWLTIEEYVQTC